MFVRRTVRTSVSSAWVLIVLTVAATTAQERAHFSGTWILVSPNGSPSNVPQVLDVEASFRRQSVRGTPLNPALVTLTVSPRSGNLVRPDIYNVGRIGGTVSGLPANGLAANGPRTSSRYSTRWDGNKLVVDFAQYTDGKLTSEQARCGRSTRQGRCRLP